MSNKIKLVLLGIFLSILTILIISISSRNYVYEVDFKSNINNINDINITLSQEDNVIEIIDKSINDNKLKIKLKANKIGKANIDVSSKEEYKMETFYVHRFNIITKNSYYGKSNNDIVIPIFMLIYISFCLYLLIKKYRKSINDNL